MKKRLRVSVCIVLILILCMGTVAALAADQNPTVRTGEAYKGDLFATGDSAIIDGTVEGDILSMVQMLSSRGNVDGDILGFAYDLSIDGNVNGNVRVASNNATLSGTIERTLMAAAGSSLTIGPKAVIKRNAYLYGTIINASGTVQGKTDIYGVDVTLSGNYQGDVILHGMAEESSLKILPGTVINGKLTYKGVTEFSVPEGVQVGSYEFVKINPVSKEQIAPRFNMWNVVKEIITLVLYYLFALLLFKLFPRFFARSGDFIAAKPLTAAGIGIATLGSLIGGALLLILLLILTIFIFKGSVFFFGGLVFTFIATITIIFADIPVSLWLGNILVKRNLSVPARLAFGFITLSAAKFALDLLGNIHAISTLVGVVSFLLNAAIWIFGTGALLRVIFEVFKSANVQAEAEETEIEPIQF